MKNLARTRLGVLRELKNVRRFLDDLERGVKNRDPEKIYPAYVFLRCLVYHLNEGDLSPQAIALAQELLHAESEGDEI